MHLFLALLPFRNFFLHRLIAAPRVNGCGTGGTVTTGDGCKAGSTNSRKNTSRTVSFESGSGFPVFDAKATDPAFAEIAGRME